MVFADDEREANPASFKFLEMAHKWKRTQAGGAASNIVALGGTSIPVFSATTATREKERVRGERDGNDNVDAENGSNQDSSEGDDD